MIQHLYVYVPGFEYDSKGPLHIDAIRLDVTTGEIERDSNGNIINSLDTYIHIDGLNTADSEFEELKPEKGNIVYRADRTTYRPSKKSDSASIPCWTKATKRANPGFFYDFITTPEGSEETHHVIGFHNNPEECLTNVSNLNSEEHDGLFIIKIDELNTDLFLNFTFYSRIDLCEAVDGINDKKITVGNTEVIENITNFTQQSDFFDNYIEIGKWTQTYNPAVSGIGTSLSLSRKEPVQQYFELSKKDDSSFKWEVPVNAEFLVTDFSLADEEGHKLPILSGTQALCLYKYDSNSYKHILDITLPCNKWSEAHKIYNNFYPDIKNSDVYIKSTDDSCFEHRISCVRNNGALFGIYKRCDAWRVYNDDFKELISYERAFTYCDLKNFNYLYKKYPLINLINLLNDGDFSNSDTPIVTGINTMTLRASGYGYLTEYFAADSNDLHHNGCDANENPLGYQYEYSYYNNPLIAFQASMGKLPGADNTVFSKDNHLDLSVSVEYHNKKSIIRSTDNTLTLAYKYFYLPTNIDSYITNVNGSILQDKVRRYTNGLTEPDLTYGQKAFYYYNLKESTSSSDNVKFSIESILETGQCTYDLNGDDILHINVEVSKPSLLLMGYNSPIVVESNSKNALSSRYQSKKGFLHSNYYYPAQGRIFVGLPWMYYIDLSSSHIQYNNTADYQIYPYLYSDEFGYSKDTLLPVNIDTKKGNLLLSEGSENSTDFELNLIISNTKSCTELRFSQSSNINSSFCNDKRFIGVNKDESPSTSAIEVNKSVTLDPGLYILKVQSLLSSLFTYTTINCKIGEYLLNQLEGHHNKWAFYVRDSCTFELTEINKKWNLSNGDAAELYDVISGIGLYKVDLSKADTSTKVLEQTYTAFVESKTDDAGFIDINNYKIYDYIIFPLMFCAKENVLFCNRIDKGKIANSTTYKHPLGDDIYNYYKNDYCTKKTDDLIYHFYNFHYMPEKAIYEVLAYYTIPTDQNRIKVEDIETVDGTKDLSFLSQEIVKL